MSDKDDFGRQTEDAFERPAPGYRAALCRKCGRIDRAYEFEFKLSKRQALAFGYKALHPVVVDSDVCKACQPRRRGVREKNAKELHTMVEMGELPRPTADALIAQLKATALRQQTDAAHKRWTQTYMNAWADMLGELRRERNRISQSMKYVAWVLQPTDGMEDAVYAARMTFLTEYRAALVQLSDRIRNLYIHPVSKWRCYPPTPDGEPGKMPRGKTLVHEVDTCHFTSLLHTAQWVKLCELWNAIPDAARRRMRPPPLLAREGAYAPDDTAGKTA